MRMRRVHEERMVAQMRWEGKKRRKQGHYGHLSFRLIGETV
jgi:hypothetical protein